MKSAPFVFVFMSLAVASLGCGAPSDLGESPTEGAPVDQEPDPLDPLDALDETARPLTTPFERGAVESRTGKILAADRTWSFVPLADTRCANDAPSGIGINPAAGAEEMVVYLQGGGACWFGAQLNFPRFAAAFPAAQIDLLADSAQLVNPQGGLTAEWVATWGIELPLGCAGCGADFPRYLDYLTTTYPTARFGLLASMRDATLTPFFNFGVNVQAFRDRTSELLTDRYEPRANARYLARSGVRHGYLSKVKAVRSRENVATFEWVSAFVAGTARNRRP